MVSCPSWCLIIGDRSQPASALILIMRLHRHEYPISAYLIEGERNWYHGGRGGTRMVG
jgi:hypothetical protein